MALLDLSISELISKLNNSEITSTALILECFDNIEKYDKSLNALITVLSKESVLKIASEKDAELARGIRKPLQGIPFVLKDSYLTKDIRTTAASNVLKDFIATYNATVYEKLLEAGAILIGKANMDAWGHGGSNENTDFGVAKNPWDAKRVPGGSSGGCAIAVASRYCSFAIGEDTGGSIRNPSAWCNTTGLKVTYGRVSRYGCIAYASSFDTVGPIGKSTEDIAYVLSIIEGKDAYDATSSLQPVTNYSQLLIEDIQPITMKIGVPKELFSEGLDPEIKHSIEHALEVYKELGAEVIEVSMPIYDFGLPVYYLIAPSETSSNLARYDGIRYGNERDNFTDETTRRILIGTYALSSGYYDAFYKKAQKARTLFIREYERLLKEVDILIMPVNPMHAPLFGELIGDPLKNLLADVYTTSQNPVGVPSLALPCGFSKDDLPIGFQLVGSMFSEAKLFKLGVAYQKVTDWHKRMPTFKNL